MVRIIEQHEEFVLIISFSLKFFLRNCFVDDPEEMKYDRIHVGACCPESLLKVLKERERARE